MHHHVTTVPPLDASTLESLYELGDADDGFVAELLETFVDQSRAIVRSLRRAFMARDSVGFGRAAHTLAGSSMNVGALRLAELARAVEMAMKSPSATPIENDFRAITEELDRVTEEIARQASDRMHWRRLAG
jgi:histidine phosphotransfer protein HptB